MARKRQIRRRRSSASCNVEHRKNPKKPATDIYAVESLFSQTFFTRVTADYPE